MISPGDIVWPKGWTSAERGRMRVLAVAGRSAWCRMAEAGKPDQFTGTHYSFALDALEPVVAGPDAASGATQEAKDARLRALEAQLATAEFDLREARKTIDAMDRAMQGDPPPDALTVPLDLETIRLRAEQLGVLLDFQNALIGAVGEAALAGIETSEQLTAYFVGRLRNAPDIEAETHAMIAANRATQERLERFWPPAEPPEPILSAATAIEQRAKADALIGRMRERAERYGEGPRGA